MMRFLKKWFTIMFGCFFIPVICIPFVFWPYILVRYNILSLNTSVIVQLIWGSAIVALFSIWAEGED